MKNTMIFKVTKFISIELSEPAAWSVRPLQENSTVKTVSRYTMCEFLKKLGFQNDPITPNIFFIVFLYDSVTDEYVLGVSENVDEPMRFKITDVGEIREALSILEIEMPIKTGEEGVEFPYLKDTEYRTLVLEVYNSLTSVQKEAVNLLIAKAIECTKGGIYT